ncbi:TetR family transcriptional regulator [Nocardia puris]|uniref:TetR family transcriptional regulator n=1 Tax=Nocardia puris TaxID=208602 RepID=A0A366DBJ8_9NOCA|nr:TetR family transcriptional regulator [Nocardia puris]MBF6214521.1 TetR family transcriptional regulator [Nocardia puris]MBF6365930.1 TetR family transcriptional regulator [Nocardia puris]MBF6460427.1 TetR family transcriptional regulator [Nocardia puris]RBO87427.1 TetR family transcriptional regulator [Nocardia puris]
MSTADRRTLIADTAIRLIASDGVRALTHRALDTALDLPAGSSSYYFRTRRALLTAVVDRITERSREDFQRARFAAPAAASPDLIARDIATWVDRLLADRSDDLRTRHALLTELRTDPELRTKLSRSLFSPDRARELFRDNDSPTDAAVDFIAVLEGAVFDRTTGNRADLKPGTPESIDQLTRLVVVYLRGH